jgi:iron(III) transport system substrate-binding protein
MSVAVKQIRRASSLIVVFCFASWLAAVPADGQSAHTAALIEGAKKEKRVVWYTAMNLAEVKPLLDAFQKKYPFVQPEAFRAGGEPTLNRILTEIRAGKWDFDCVTITQMGTLIQHKALSPYISPETKGYVPEFKDAAGYWSGLGAIYFIIGYNPKLVSEKDAPKRWEDFLDPKWKGKISIDREEYPWYAGLVSAWGKEKTDRYMEALAKQDIQWRKGHTLIAQLMAAGEFPVGIVYAHRIEDMKKKGAPVEWVNTPQPIVVSLSRVAISAEPKHPAAAKLFTDFLLSTEGQEMQRAFGFVPARPDVEAPSPKMAPAKLKLKAVPEDFGTRANEYGQEFRRIFGL